MRPFDQLFRKSILAVKPYASARSEYPAGLPASNELAMTTTFLDANENAFGSPSGGLEPAHYSYNRYPDPLQHRLKSRIAEIKGMPANRTNTIFLGNGSDEPIDLIMRAFCEPSNERASGDAIIITPPTYGMYEVSASINNVEVRRVPLVHTAECPYMLDAEAVLNAVTPRTKLIFLCSPNNPTGNTLQRTAMERVIAGFDGVVVVDEAYSDFAPAKSLLPRLAEFPNVIILQTLSKAWGLAGLRLGMAFADEQIIAVMNKIKPPYNINVTAQEAALEALSNQSWKEETVRQAVRLRDELTQSLDEISLVERVFPSEANFLLVKMRDAHHIYEELVRQNIIVRDRSGATHSEGCVRITVGTEQENKLLLEALRALS
jgi:histidinol-phosphate aminotransferase